MNLFGELIIPGRRFRKIKGEIMDLHKIGAEGVVQGFIGPMPSGEEFAGEYGYYVLFDGDEHKVFIRGAKIEEIKK